MLIFNLLNNNSLYKLIAFIGFIFISTINKAQQFKNNVAGPYVGLGAYSKKFVDVFAMANNQASLGNIKQSGVGVFGERRFGLAELNNYALHIALPITSGTFGVQANRFGFTGFSETQLGLGYGRNLGEKVSVGGKINYYSQQIASYGNTSTVNIDAGLLLHLTSKLNAGISTFNPTGGKFGVDKTEKLASIYKFGLGYDVSDKVYVAAELVKEENSPVNLVSAVHYQFEKKFFAKVGLSTAASNIFVAAGLSLNNQFRLDVFASHHRQLGFSPGILLQYRFNKNN
jgi:hypothetical protein